MLKLKTKYLLLFFGFLIIQLPVYAQYSKQEKITETSGIKDSDTVKGYGILKRLPGLWNGPVFSSTPAGSFEKWYVDFRPVSAGQVSQFSMLDSQTVNIISFFIVKYKGELKVAMRTEGCFAKKCCVTYEVIDSVNEASGYYRFVDFISGKKRAFSEFVFNGNEMKMSVYTNKFNKEKSPQLHSVFQATLTDTIATLIPVKYFDFPQPLMIKDFCDVFKNMTESIFFDLENDPYKSSAQPYVGSLSITVSIDSALKTKSSDEICILLTTRPLFSGIKYNAENMNYLSKYVYFPVGTTSFTIKNIHPGKYFLYSFSDINNDKKHLSGDYMSSDVNKSIEVFPDKTSEVNTTIDFVIP